MNGLVITVHGEEIVSISGTRMSQLVHGYCHIIIISTQIINNRVRVISYSISVHGYAPHRQMVHQFILIQVIRAQEKKMITSVHKKNSYLRYTDSRIA